MNKVPPEIHRANIKVKAFGILRRGDQILVGLGEDRLKGDRFGRVVGGTVELGELSRDTLVREMMEEFGIAVTITRPLGWLENIFTYEGVPGHEVIAVYEIATEDTAIFEKDTMPILDADATAAWISLAELEAKGMKLYPTGLGDIIRREY